MPEQIFKLRISHRLRNNVQLVGVGSPKFFWKASVLNVAILGYFSQSSPTGRFLRTKQGCRPFLATTNDKFLQKHFVTLLPYQNTLQVTNNNDGGYWDRYVVQNKFNLYWTIQVLSIEPGLWFLAEYKALQSSVLASKNIE